MSISVFVEYMASNYFHSMRNFIISIRILWHEISFVLSMLNRKPSSYTKFWLSREMSIDNKREHPRKGLKSMEYTLTGTLTFFKQQMSANTTFLIESTPSRMAREWIIPIHSSHDVFLSYTAPLPPTKSAFAQRLNSISILSLPFSNEVVLITD